MEAHFTEAAVKFLRGLNRHNDRVWFDARKDVYEAELKAPMLAVIEEVNAALAGFAPEHVRPPQKCMMRIYRDIRFSKNKLPYKTNLAAWWARQGLEKTSGGGFYFQFSPDEVLVAGGAYMPEKDQVLAIRRYLLDHHEQYRKLMSVAAKLPLEAALGPGLVKAIVHRMEVAEPLVAFLNAPLVAGLAAPEARKALF